VAEDSFQRPAAYEVFVKGFESIAERYIEPAPPGDFAFEGLRGLSSIDPALSVRRDDADIVLAISGEDVARFQAPAPDNAAAWADLTVEATVHGRAHSAELGKASQEKIFESVFDGILSNLDIYSRYAGVEEARRNRAKRQGFGGIGIRFRVFKDEALITQVLPDTPAYQAGIKYGDRITHVGTKAITGMTQDTLGELLRGPVGSRVAIRVSRKGADAPMDFDIARVHIVPDTVTYGHEDGIVFLKIASFNQRTANNVLIKMKKARETLGDQLHGVILDMRGNPGGLLKQAINVADVFLTQGRIIETRGRHPDSLQHYDAGGLDMAQGLPLAILIDGKSASSAEVAAAALQDRGRAVVIGTTSFGKGTVQTVIRLPNDGELTLTWSRLMSPSGYILHGLGVLPTICTSGGSGNGEELIERALAERIRTNAVMEGWRRADVNDAKLRRDMRAFCPPQRRTDATDTKVARRLLLDKTLFARAINQSAAAAAAR